LANAFDATEGSRTSLRRAARSTAKAVTTTDWIVLVVAPPLVLLAVAWGAVLLAPWVMPSGLQLYLLLVPVALVALGVFAYWWTGRVPPPKPRPKQTTK